MNEPLDRILTLVPAAEDILGPSVAATGIYGYALSGASSVHTWPPPAARDILSSPPDAASSQGYVQLPLAPTSRTWQFSAPGARGKRPRTTDANSATGARTRVVRGILTS